MRLRPPYTVEEIEATPYEYDLPWRETRRAKMWQARIDYWTRMQRVSMAVTAVFTIGWLVALIVAVTH